ncbi:flavoprotein [Streptomyces sp. NPDC085927]|uniref:flavoprotein n=1 Tax=Streptomyces sp. NPDC085927 TaxID=3365738 RepID=UPI0037D0EEF9
MTDETPPLPPHPAFGFSRLLVVVTGAVNASETAGWVTWIRACYPDLEYRIVLTHSAQRFVTRTALSASAGSSALVDEWPEHEGVARHVEWAGWADAVVVYPATMHYLARLATGMADTPSLLAAHCTSSPISLAMSVPPGAITSPVYMQHLELLTARKNIDVIPPVRGISVSTGRNDGWGPAPLPEVFARLEKRRQGK